MRTRISVLATAIAIATASFCFASEHHQANIEGFLSGEFAVKGTIEQQVNQRVVNPLSAEMSKAKGAQIAFVVVGSADHTGGGAQNDRLAKSRADEVSAFLLEKFPGAKFVTLTKGDERNAKMVTVTWTVTPTATLAKGTNQPAMLTGAIAVFLILILFATLRRKKEMPQRSVEQSNLLTMPAPALKPKSDGEVVEVEWAGKVYSMFVPNKNGMWETPFRTSDGNGFIVRRDFKDVVGSLRSYLKKPECWPLIAELIAQGKIQRRKVA